MAEWDSEESIRAMLDDAYARADSGASEGVEIDVELDVNFRPYVASGRPGKKLGVCALSQMAMMGKPVKWVSQWDERDEFSGGVNLTVRERNAQKMNYDGKTIRASRRAIEALNEQALKYMPYVAAAIRG